MKKCLRVWSLLLAAALLGLSACVPHAQSPVTPPADTESPVISGPPEPTPSPTPSVETTPVPLETPPPPPPTDDEVEAFFDDAVFVGDSVTAGIEQYARKLRKEGAMLGGARFLSTTIGVKISDCAGDNGGKTLYFSYKGAEKPLEQILAEMEAGKVFIMLGMNDLAGGDPIPDIIDGYGRMLDKIEEACPGVEIFIELNTPRTDSTWVADYTPNKKFYNSLIDAFVEEVRSLCEARGLACIDLNTPLKAGTAGLPQDYTRDGYLHLSDAGAKVAVDTIYEFVRGELSRHE